ncbi:hypothetical protein Tco_1025431 [Tanacetum coccineum]
MAPNLFYYSLSSPFHLAVKTRGKRKLRDKMDYSSGRIHGGKVKSVNPRQFLSLTQAQATSSMEKHTWNVELAYLPLLLGVKNLWKGDQSWKDLHGLKLGELEAALLGPLVQLEVE